MTPTAAPSPPSAPARPTADDFWEFVHRPENAGRRFELVDGEVVEVSQPKMPHAYVVANLVFLLELYVRSRGRGGVAPAGGLVLDEGGTVVSPDVAVYADVPPFADVPPKWADDPPVLAVEVLSPNDKRKLVQKKIAAYLDAGVAAVWVVDPDEQFVTVYRANATPRAAADADALTVAELPGLACPVADLFRTAADRAASPAVPPAPEGPA